ncbi:hypothetical protein ANCCAN_01188 [Ancylostoma caninum]|uniref:Major facilitator superfamily (MFS) profile domain-containing protein n=1 Tax=Ancylostoma caninum TaxID=29170 RepID=A0A368H884_ANCCA|nr:hypothetical protein ANCCAN_01188 [Ancylostoma caninum]
MGRVISNPRMVPEWMQTPEEDIFELEIVVLYKFEKCLQGVGILVVNLVGSVFIEYTWDACFLCAVESLETSCRGSGTGSCSLMARFGAISAPFLTYMNNFWPPSVYFSVFVLGSINLIVSFNYLIETKGVNLDNVTVETVECNDGHFLLQRRADEAM